MKHRRIISLLSAALMGFSVTAFPPAFFEQAEIVAEAASGTTKDGLKWLSTAQNTVSIQGYSGSKADVSVPSKIEGMPVTAVSANAFNEIKYVKTISLPDSIETIGKYAFKECHQLTKIVIPEKVTLLQAKTFYNCKNLKHVEIKGAAKIEEYVFSECKALENVTMNPDCTRAVSFEGKRYGLSTSLGVFNNCTSLKKINDTTVVNTTSDGKPYIVNNTAVRTIIGKFIMRSENVKFVKDYCNKLCDYVIKTELVAGMSDAIHARQLHDWITRNIDYMKENGSRYGEAKSKHDPEYSSYTGVLLSYGLFGGTGEAVCSGFAYVYERLLHSAHIESYVLSNAEEGQIKADDHAWTLAKLEGKWYQIDVTWDDGSGTYDYFMKSNAQMIALNKIYNDPGVHLSLYHTTNEDLDAGVAALAKANYKYDDQNGDGILDGDWNLNGAGSRADITMRNRLAAYLGKSTVSESYMKTWVNKLVKAKKTPDKFLTDAGY